MTLLPDPLVKGIAAGERFERLSVVVRGMAHKMRPADEDMLQIGLTKLWELIVSGEEREDRYLVAAARNAMIDRIRYQKIREREKKVTDLLALQEGGSCQDSGEALDTDIEDLLAMLPAHLARAFRLHIFHEYTLAEVAKIMQRPLSTVATWIRKAKRFLRKELE